MFPVLETNEPDDGALMARIHELEEQLQQQTQQLQAFAREQGQQLQQQEHQLVAQARDGGELRDVARTLMQQVDAAATAAEARALELSDAQAELTKMKASTEMMMSAQAQLDQVKGVIYSDPGASKQPPTRCRRARRRCSA
eukprot:1099039-Prymnesium_polylepis.1